MSEHVDVWYVLPDSISSPELLAAYGDLLSREEMARHDRYWFARDRHLHLVAWALVRTMLSHFSDVAPEDWCFRTNRHGRPQISGPAGRPPLRFNLSHTRGLVACAVAHGIDVGVDVEDRHRITAAPRIARRFFSAAEVAAFERRSTAAQQGAFFEYWTLKEAYIKAVGVGISLGLGRFSFAIDERGLGLEDPDRRTPTISFDASLDDDPATWQFAQFEPTPDHYMAVAVRRGDRDDVVIRVREVVPGLD